LVGALVGQSHAFLAAPLAELKQGVGLGLLWREGLEKLLGRKTGERFVISAYFTRILNISSTQLVACPCSGSESYLVFADDEPDNGVPELVQHDNPLLQIPHCSVNQFPPAPDMAAMPCHHLQHVRLCVLRPHDEHLDILLC
jgi:hypothetical protein